MSSESPMPRRSRPDSGQSIGLGILLPGFAQWGRGQRGRGKALFGCFAAAILTAAMAWGTWPGGLALLVAFAVHWTSAVDAIRAAAFPGVGRGAAGCFALFGLGLGCYLPALAAAATLAWPADGPGGRYLVDRSAYRQRTPAADHWIWVREPGGQGGMLARVLATPGQAIAAQDGRLIISGPGSAGVPGANHWDVEALTFEVPEGFLLIASAPEPGEGASGRVELVARAEVLGRPWARLAPVWPSDPPTGRGGNWPGWGDEAWPERVAVGTILERR